MIDIIRKVLREIEGIAGWKVIENQTEAAELFFIGKKLDMNRGKKVAHYQVTVYKDFENDGQKYRGSSSTSIHPTMTEEEIIEAITEASFAAGYVRNEYYPLVEPVDIKADKIESSFAGDSLSVYLSELTDALYQADNYQKGRLNSAEFFLNRINKRIINSKGIDVSFEKYQGEIEFITNWQESGEEVELYKKLDFANFDPELITTEVEEMLKMSREKALADPTPALKDCPVILTGESVEEFMKYYLMQSGSEYVYQQISTSKVGDNVQGNEVEGDLINLQLDPYLKGSSQSAPYDNDGFPLQAVTVFADGVLKNYWGNQRYSYYLDVEPTGKISNFIVQGGSQSIEALKGNPYLELLAFSDFQMDPLTGNFAGEIRLGRYYDGQEVKSVTGGSISGNIKEVQQNMILSSEVKQSNNFLGPQSIKLKKVNIAGN